MIGLPRQPRRIKLRRGGVTVQAMGIEAVERPLDLTRGGAPYPPILRAGDKSGTIADAMTRADATDRKARGVQSVRDLIADRRGQNQLGFGYGFGFKGDVP
jgi:hypothetical protein